MLLTPNRSPRRWLPLSLVLFLPAALMALFAASGQLPKGDWQYLLILVMPLLLIVFKTFVPLTILGLIGLTLEVLFARLSRFWLLPVVGILGFYYSHAIPENLAFRQAMRLAEAHNAAIRLDFDARRYGVVYSEERFPRDEDADPHLGQTLLLDYGVPVVWNRKSGQALRLIDRAFCEELKTRYPGIHIGFGRPKIELWLARSGGRGGAAARPSDGRFCLLGLPETAPDTALRLDGPGAWIAAGGDLQIPTLRLQPPGEAPAVEVARSTPTKRPLTLIPLLLDADDLTRRDRARGDFAPGIAQALGLVRNDPAARRASDTAPLSDYMQRLMAYHLTRQIALLDRAISGLPQLAATPADQREPDARLLQLEAAAVEARIPQVLAAMADHVALQARGAVPETERMLQRTRAIILETALRATPDAQFADLVPQLRRLIASGYRVETGSIRERLKNS